MTPPRGNRPNQTRALYPNRRHPEPGFSRVKDLARIGTGPWFVEGVAQSKVPGAPREILHGLKAVQDDAVQRQPPESDEGTLP
jgi:hypothetical protein